MKFFQLDFFDLMIRPLLILIKLNQRLFEDISLFMKRDADTGSYTVHSKINPH